MGLGRYQASIIIQKRFSIEAGLCISTSVLQSRIDSPKYEGLQQLERQDSSGTPSFSGLGAQTDKNFQVCKSQE